MINKKTKIVATIGPASSPKEVLTQMIAEGLNVARLNFSHGTHEDHLEVINTINEIREETGQNIAILADLQGPKLRLGEVENGVVDIEPGQEVVITTESQIGNAQKVFITYPEFPQDVKQGEKVLIDDGNVILEVLNTDGKTEVLCKVIHGAKLKSRKGVNLPNTKISLPCLTEKDLRDLDFVLEHELDWVGLSFVRTARDIIELKHIISEKRKKTKVIAKIEKPEAIEDIDFIIKESDGIMIARGDLGVEIPMQQVPLIQKEIAKKSRDMSKPVIIATQMMESMIENISPTRAEVNDVANAVLDGADAVMLSGETSVGKFPIETIINMAKIVMEIEKSEQIYFHETFPDEINQERFLTDSICYNAVRLAQRVDAKSIITMTYSGYTAFKLSSQRPKAPVLVFTSNKEIMSMLSLVWGVESYYYDKMVSTDHTIQDIAYLLKKEGRVAEGDFIVNTASIPIAEKGKTNMLKLTEI